MGRAVVSNPCKGSRIKQREMCSCDAVTTKASANPPGSSEVRMALHRCLGLRGRGWAFAPLHGPVTEYRNIWVRWLSPEPTLLVAGG